MLTLFAFLFALGVLITVHEYGHYKMARCCGVKVLRFSIGFGRPICRWRCPDNSTEFVIGLLPLGGYIKMLDEEEASVALDEQHLAFNRQSLWVRAAVVAAGPAANLLLAVFLYACVHWIGVVHIAPVISQVVPGGIAQKAGVQTGDRVLRVNQKEVQDADQLTQLVATSSGQEQVWDIERSGVTIHLTLTPQRVPDQAVARVGVYVGGVEAAKFVRYGPLQGFWQGVVRTRDMAVLNLRMMGQMLMGQASLQNLGGPLTIAEYAGRSAELGLTTYLSFLALISVGLGVLNLLPIPLLDGAHLLYYFALALTRRDLSRIWMLRLQQVGFVVLLAVTALALFNDLQRLFG